MKTGFVNSRSFLEGDHRIDPDLYLSDGAKIRREIHNLPYELSTVGENAENVFYGNIFSRMFVSKPSHGVEYLAASDTVLSDLHTGRYISKIQAKGLSYLILKKGWILVTCSGTLGNVTYTTKEFAGKLATHDLIRIIPNNKKVNAGTLYAFLSSKYGYYQITQSQFGGVVKHINESQMSSVLVPVFSESFQAEVDDLIQESARLREEANDKLEKAQNKLSAFINVKFNKVNFKTSCVNFNEVMSSLRHRIDPPALMSDGVYSMKEVNSKFTCKKICELKTKVFRPGIFKRIYVEEGIPYIKGSEIFLTDPFRRCVHLSKSRTPFVDEMTLHEGQILITCAGSVGDIKIITKDYEDNKAIGSQDIIRLESTDPLYTKEYLFTYLRQPFVYDYIQSMKYGSVIERIEPFHVESIPVVEPTEELSKEITSLIDEYMDCTYHAYTAENKAIKKVEDEIEKWNKTN